MRVVMHTSEAEVTFYTEYNPDPRRTNDRKLVMRIEQNESFVKRFLHLISGKQVVQVCPTWEMFLTQWQFYSMHEKKAAFLEALRRSLERAEEMERTRA